MNILGISGQEKDAAAALVQDGRVVAAIEEEKLARIRHVGMNYAGGLPFRAIEFCLERGGIAFGDIDYVAYYLEPHKLFHREIAFNSSRATDALNVASIEDFPPYFVDSLNGLKQRLRTKRLVESRLSSRGKFVAVGHHLAHGASAFYASGFERAAVIAADNRGDMTTTALMTGAGHELMLHVEAQFPNSIGMVYSAVTAALGFGFDDDWHKTMWISPTGENEFREAFNELIKVDAGGLPVVDMNFFEISSRGDLSLSDDFFNRVGLKRRALKRTQSVKSIAISRRACKRVLKMCCAKYPFAIANGQAKKIFVLREASRSTVWPVRASSGAQDLRIYSCNLPPETPVVLSALRFTSGINCSATASAFTAWSTHS